jgi:hypothetical protein
MENLFLQAMPISERTEIDNIKANKDFARKLASDLSKVFQINLQISDSIDSSQIYVGTMSQRFNCPYFIAKKDGVIFNMNVLGYRGESQLFGRLLGDLYEKYKDSATADNNFLNEKSGHGNVTFRIQIPLQNYDDVLRDILSLFKLNRYAKVF